jgi:myo-inositol-1(or 4)-monophosphatase
MSSQSLLSAELSVVQEAALAAGKVLLRHFGTGLAVDMKAWADPVTAADRESEALIRSALRKAFPADGIIGEEEAPQPSTSGRTWIVDPLDGTVNFAGGMPLFAVVLALVEESDPDRALLNVTYDPVRDELFHAVRGGGAFLNGQSIRVSANADFSRAMVHIHFSNKAAHWEESVETARQITAVAPHARSIGSTALAQAYVASGRLDAHVKPQSGAYDVVGGNLLIEEAGGVATDLAGSKWRVDGSLCAANTTLHSELIRLVRGRA